jgi:hypothetical protein
MRKAFGAAALALAAITAPAWAQGVAGFMGRATPNTQIVNVPIDTSMSVVGPMTEPRSFNFNFSNLFSWVKMPGFPPHVGQSPLPAPSSFPSTHYPNKFQPLKPIIPGQ